MNTLQYKSIMQALKAYDMEHDTRLYAQVCKLTLKQLHELKQVYISVLMTTNKSYSDLNNSL